MKEQWKEFADGYYEVSNHGRVRRAKPGPGSINGKLLQPATNKKGYLQIAYCVGGRPRSSTVHRLVAEAFIGKRPDGLQVNHKDGDKTNNMSDNIEYVTTKENIHHAFRNGLRTCKYPQSKVDRIRRLHDDGVPARVIAEDVGICRAYCLCVIRGDLRSTNWEE